MDVRQDILKCDGSTQDVNGWERCIVWSKIINLKVFETGWYKYEAKIKIIKVIHTNLE